ncbi:MAG: phosphodiesterase/alkaline phosphatase D-like protein [Verrucomicrobiales bacterium]
MISKNEHSDNMKLMSSVPITILLLLFSFALTLNGSAAPKLIQAGPMIGHVSPSTATIWVRVKQGSVLTGIALQDNVESRLTELTDLDDGFFLVHFDDLAPATPTTVTLKVSRNGSTQRELVSFRTAPEPADTGKIRIAFGSCSKLSQYDGAPIYDCMAKEKPDVAIFAGDNSYFIVADGSANHFSTSGPRGDWNFEESMTARHLVTRVHPDVQAAFRSIPSYGIWDDHDYGPNNADRNFELKEEALRAFQQVWGNPGWGTKDTPGVFSKFRLGPVEVFLMDGRYYKYSPDRYDDVTPKTGEIWGKAQTEWLLEGLKESTAPVKLIANGTQVLSAGMRGEGHFQEARNERQQLLDFASKNKIGGIVFISGDRHFSEAMQLSQPDGTLVVEGTSSPFQQGQSIGHLVRPHDNQLWAMVGNSYGLITVDVPEPGAGTVTFETRDESNSVPILYDEPRSTTWSLNQLNYGGDDETPSTWTSIFNGENLDGWEQKNGTATYRVNTATVIGKTAEDSPNSFLCTTKEYADFELMFDVNVDRELNSGVQIRSESFSDYKNGRVHGPQVEIEASPGESGYIYSEGTGKGWMSQERNKNVFRNGQWNHYYIRAVGSRIQTWVNGIAVADVTEDEMSRKGFIGLQVHGIRKGAGPFEVRWRNIFVKELPSP